MNEVVVDTSVTGMLASATLLTGIMLILSLVAMTLMYRYFQQISRQQNKIIKELQDDIRSLSSGAHGIDKRLNRFEQKFKQLSRRQYLYEVQQMKNKNYERAKDMIISGEKVSKVVANCQLSKTEAELILLANKMNKVA